MTFLGDEIRKGLSVIVEVCIRSLNSHYRSKGTGTACGRQSK